MVHSSHKCPIISKYSFNLTRQLKLPFLVDIILVPYWPPVLYSSVDHCSVGLKLTPWFYILLKETRRMPRYTVVPGTMIYANFLLPCSFPMIRVMPLKYASSNCIIFSKITALSGKWSRNNPYQCLRAFSLNSVSAMACLTGTWLVQHQSVSQNFWYDNLMPVSHVCESKENFSRQCRQRYRCSYCSTFWEPQTGQWMFLPKTVLRKYLRIWASDGICFKWYISAIVANLYHQGGITRPRKVFTNTMYCDIIYGIFVWKRIYPFHC